MKILIFKEKYETIYLNADGDNLYKNALSVVKKRYAEGWYEEQSFPKEILENQDGKLAWQLLQARKNFEYESVELETVLEKLNV